MHTLCLCHSLYNNYVRNYWEAIYINFTYQPGSSMDDVVVIPKVQRLTSAYHFLPTAECCQ